MPTHRGIHDANAVCPDRVCNMTDVDGVQVFIVAGPFHKYL